MSERLQYSCDEHGWCDYKPCPQCHPPNSFAEPQGSVKSLPTTCEECDRLGWPTKQPLHGIEGRTLCWTHAQIAISAPGSASQEDASLKQKYEWLWNNCLIVLWPGDGLHPIEHNKNANKDSRDRIEAQMPNDKLRDAAKTKDANALDETT